MSKGIFVTGTGTDVGKTYVTALIVKALRENKINVGYYKAALSGAYKKGDDIVPGDSEIVLKAGKISEDPKEFVSYIYETAVSPHLASQIEHNPIQLDYISSHFDNIKKKYDYITVEGSGGIVCPLRFDEEKIMLIDVIKHLNLDIIIISSSGLGSINDAVLTVEYARNRDINVKGIILNKFEDENLLHIDNKKMIEYLTGISVVGCVHKDEEDLNIPIDILCELYKEV